MTTLLANLQEFLLRLTPWRAFGLFGIALGSSGILIYLNWGEPVLPSVPVVIYGSVLYYCQAWLHIQLGPTVKDSPYFLGFLLTLFGLFCILYSPALLSADRTVVIHGVASALLTTVVGLFMRQLLSSRDPTEKDYDTRFRELADEIRKDTVEFHDAQKLFINLITEFTKTREELMSREEKAFAEYVEHLKAGTTILSKIERQYPEKVEALLDAIDESARKLKERLDQVEAAFSHTATVYAEDMERERKSLAEGSRDFNAQLSTLRSVLSEDVNRERESLAEANHDFNNQLNALRSTLSEDIDRERKLLTEANQEFNTQLSTLRLTLSEAMATFKLHADGVGGLAGFYSKAGTELTTSVTDVVQEIRNAQSNLTGLVNDLKAASADVRGIDSIIDDLIRLLNKKLAALEPGA